MRPQHKIEIMPYRSANNAEYLKIWMFEKVVFCVENIICILVFLVCSGLYIDVLSVSTRFSVIFCVYEHI